MNYNRHVEFLKSDIYIIQAGTTIQMYMYIYMFMYMMLSMQFLASCATHHSSWPLLPGAMFAGLLNSLANKSGTRSNW